MTRFKPLVQLATAILCGAALVTLIASRWWVADLLANLRVQQMLALLVAVPFTMLLAQWRCLTVQMAILAVHAPWFASAFISEDRWEIEPSCRVLFANVLTSNRDFDEIVYQITESDPDVFAIFELSTGLARRLQDRFDNSFDYEVVRPEDGGNFGIGIFSKHPLADVDVFGLGSSIESIAATMTIQDRQYRFVATHPPPPMAKAGYDLRNIHLMKLAKHIDSFRSRNADVHVIVVGDFNLTPWSPVFSAFKETSGLHRAGRGCGLEPTWYALQHFVFGLLLDHAMISDDLVCVAREIHEDSGSDHCAVTVDLAQRPSNG